jgi:hypothetical protein
MTAPAPGPRYSWSVPAGHPAGLFLRIIAVACVVAILIAAFMVLGDSKVTADRVATMGISTGVLGGILILI